MTNAPVETTTDAPGTSRLNSIFLRCALLMAMTTIVVAGVLSTGSLRLMNRMADADVSRQVTKAVVSGGEAIAKPLRFKVIEKVDEEVQKLLDSADGSGVVALVLDAEGTLISAKGAGGEDLSHLEQLARVALESGAVQLTEGGSHMAQPILAAPEGPILGVVALEASFDAHHALVWANAQWIFLLAAVTFVVMMGLTVFLLSRMLGKPLKALGEAVARVSEKDYDTDSGMSDRKDEFGGIARNLAVLMTVLREGRAAEQRRLAKMEEQLRVVEQLGHALDVLADGVLHWKIDEAFPPDYESLRNNYNRAVSHLRTVVTEVVNSTDNILANSDQIAAASDDLSRRTETQAATLEQSAAAMEEMLNAVKSAARNAGEANKTMLHTREIAEKNGEVMKSAVTAMDEIEKSSDQISEITSVIDDIAFQTNLLALNAGVEAARAGESGKGFAVVASEVRGLAQRSAEAAQQIKELILGSGEQVKHGVRLVEAAGSALEDVLSKVADVSKMVEHIAASAEDQAQGLNEINEGIANLDRVTQQNAAMVEESTAAAQMLHNEADTLSKLVGRFETEESGRSGSGARESRAA